MNTLLTTQNGNGRPIQITTRHGIYQKNGPFYFDLFQNNFEVYFSVMLRHEVFHLNNNVVIPKSYQIQDDMKTNITLIKINLSRKCKHFRK